MTASSHSVVVPNDARYLVVNASFPVREVSVTASSHSDVVPNDNARYLVVNTSFPVREVRVIECE
jgi:hypothetical protein